MKRKNDIYVSCRFPSPLVFVSVTKIAGIWHVLRAFYWLSQYALIYAKQKVETPVLFLFYRS